MSPGFVIRRGKEREEMEGCRKKEKQRFNDWK